MARTTLAFVVVALIGLLVAGCSSSDPASSGSGRVRILLTDAPLDLSTTTAVNVTLTEFKLYPAGEPVEDGSGIVVGTPGVGGETVNLLDYQDGATVLVASGEVPEGDYTRIRLVVTSAELVHDDDGDPATPDITEPIFLPSGKVDIPVPFTVGTGETLEITLDFDAQSSVQVNETPGQHRFILRPVVTPVGMSEL
jgi:hypothetical protein